MRTAYYISGFIIISILLALTIRTSDKIRSSARNAKSTIKHSLLGANKRAHAVVLEKWTMPDVLEEVSAINYLDSNRFACIQDEIGKIFIYNTNTKAIEEEIPFAEKGDYEGLAVVNNTAYVLRSDGVILAVNNFLSGKPSVVQHRTALGESQDTEGLCFDKQNNRLLIAIKGKDLEKNGTKGLYSFDLTKMKFNPKPIVSIDLDHELFKDLPGKKKNALKPSEVAINPKGGNIYITDGAKPKLLILNNKGELLALKELTSSDFSQPEGMTFSPDGQLYISNEGRGDPANILKVELN